MHAIQRQLKLILNVIFERMRSFKLNHFKYQAVTQVHEFFFPLLHYTLVHIGPHYFFYLNIYTELNIKKCDALL